MRAFFSLAALAGVVLGVAHFRKFLNEHGKSGAQERRLEVWEGEGGAVPVAPGRTAAQITPHDAPPLSARGVG